MLHIRDEDHRDTPTSTDHRRSPAGRSPALVRGQSALELASQTARRRLPGFSDPRSLWEQIGALTRENEQLRQDLREKLQSTLLSIPIRSNAVRFGHLYEPATNPLRVGGDFYDLFDLPGGRTAALIGDVSGKGLQAAVLTLLVRHAVRAYAYEHDSPAEVLYRTNELTVQSYPEESFVTVFYCTIDSITGNVTYSTGGHPPPAVLGASAEPRLLRANGLAVGVWNDGYFGQDEFVLARDESLVLYTDGLTEARMREGFLGETGLLEILRVARTTPIEELPDEIMSLLRMISDLTLHDDLAIMSLGLKER